MSDQTKQTKPAESAPAAPQTSPTPATATFTGQLPYEAFRAQQSMSDIEQGRALQMDQTVPMGKYLNEDGTLVDADGKPLKGEKD